MPSRARDQQGLERHQAGVVPQERLEHLVRTGWRQGIEPQLRVVGLAAPAVLILGPIVDQQQETGRRQALDEAVEQRLRLGVDPVQVLKDQQQGLRLALAQQHPLERFQRALTSLRRVELEEGAVRRQGIQERQQGWQRGSGASRPASAPAR